MDLIWHMGCRQYKTAKEEGKELGWNDGEDVSYYRYFINLFNRKYDDKLAGKIIEELSELASNNVWIKYFTAIYESRKQAGKDGWIDFESEISSVIQALDSACKTIREQLQQGNDKAKMEQWQLNILSPFISKDGATLKMESCFFELKAVCMPHPQTERCRRYNPQASYTYPDISQASGQSGNRLQMPPCRP